MQHDNKEASESEQTMAQNPNLKIVDDQLLTKEQDDLLYGTVNPTVTRMAVADPAQYWPRTTMAFPINFYSFHSSVTDSERNLIRKAMIEYETKTCLRFQQSNRGNRVRYRSDLIMGCQSRIGRIPEIRPQHIFLSNSLCF